MRDIITFLTCLWYLSTTSAQQNTISPYYSPLQLARKSETFFLKNNDSIYYYASAGYRIAEANNDTHGMAYNNLMKANYFSLSGSSPDSIRKYIDLATSDGLVDDIHYLKWLQLSYGELYHQISNYERSAEFYLKYIDKCDENKDLSGLAFGYMRLAQALRHFGLFSESIKYHHLAWEIGKNIMDSTFHRTNLDYLNFSLEDHGLIDSALTIKSVANSYATTDHQAGRYYQNADKGFQYWNKRNRDSASFYFLKTLDIVTSENNLAAIVETLGDIAMMEESFGNMELARKYWKLFEENKGLNEYASLFYLPYLSNHLNNEGNHARAYELLKFHQGKQQALLREDMANSVTENLTKFEVAKKEEALNKANLFINHQAKIRNYLLLGVLTMSSIGLYLWSRSRYRQHIAKQKITLAQQEVQLQKQYNEDLKRQQNLIAMQSMIHGQEKEKNRIARDLHDGLGGVLSSLKLTLGQIGKQSNAEMIKNKVELGSDLIDRASRELSRIAQNLMPESLSKFGLIIAVEDLVGEVGENYNLNIQFEHYNLHATLTDEFSLSMYRIIQELLHNITKHAQANEVILQIIQFENNFNITVEDDGIGFDPDNIPKGSGLQNIAARTSQFEGHYKIDSSSNKGSTITISCKIPNYTSNKNEKLHGYDV